MSVCRLPSEYEKIKEVNLVTDKKAAITVNVTSILMIVVLLISGAIFCGKIKLESLILFEEKKDFWLFIGKVALVVALCGAYVILHEMIHATLMKLFCKESKITVRYRFCYAYAASNGFYDKKSYNIIAVTPLVFFGVLLSIVSFLVPVDWFWTVYIVQIFNFSAAAGDLYIFVLISRMSKDVLVQDSGTEIAVYGK